MTPASVGFQCPECVREGRASVRAPRRGSGLQAAGRRWGAVTLTLIAANVAMFVVSAISAASRRQLAAGQLRLARLLRAVPVAQRGLPSASGGGSLTAAFLHIGPVHLVMNMLGLLIFGSELERQLGRGGSSPCTCSRCWAAPPPSSCSGTPGARRGRLHGDLRPDGRPRRAHARPPAGPPRAAHPAGDQRVHQLPARGLAPRAPRRAGRRSARRRDPGAHPAPPARADRRPGLARRRPARPWRWPCRRSPSSGSSPARGSSARRARATTSGSAPRSRRPRTTSTPSSSGPAAVSSSRVRPLIPSRRVTRTRTRSRAHGRCRRTGPGPDVDAVGAGAEPGPRPQVVGDQEQQQHHARADQHPPGGVEEEQGEREARPRRPPAPPSPRPAVTTACPQPPSAGRGDVRTSYDRRSVRAAVVAHRSSTRSGSHARCRHLCRRAYPGGQARGRAVGGARRGPLRARPERAGRAVRARPRRRGGRLLGLRQPGRRADLQHRPQRPAGRRLARVGARHHHRPAVRLLPAGGRLRRRDGHQRPGRRRRRRRSGVDEPGAHGLDARGRGHGHARWARGSSTATTASSRTRASARR